ncbi:heavy-metal-associated domain-containing protein [Chitinimonas sp.]|uniref:heavy-metal-associated domain-containing protein n=1 Tax=Chitinimonas sp. TaxID=1934313 RepID=UPI002F94088C
MEQQFQIEGMSCGGCVASVEKALKAVTGVTAVAVDLALGQAKVDYDASRTNPTVLRQAIEDAGYDVTG